MRILIAGCGYVGSVLAGDLAARGDEVFGLRRNPSGLPPGVTPVAADVSAPETLKGVPADLDAVVYAVSAGAREDPAYRRAYVEGVEHLCGVVAPARFVFVSSTSVYGQVAGEWVDEESPTEPRAFAGRRVLEGEQLARAAPGGVAIRFGGIYGPGRTRLRDSVAEGRARWRPQHFTNRIHRDDCAGALRHLLDLERPESVYVGVDREPSEERTVLEWLARRAGVEAPSPSESGAETRGVGSKRCSSRRLVESGYVFRYPTFREGYAALGTDPEPS
ncbi:MAG: SDR family oxidoreductase [Myxococcales bacterium]|nr:SDR family oxidoreductase [Myxococcales bacterium]